jgi:hypothetical protein
MTNNKLLFTSNFAEKSAIESIRTSKSIHIGQFDSSLSKTINFIFWPTDAEMSSACQRIADGNGDTVCFRIFIADLEDWAEDIKAEGEENDIFSRLTEEQENIESIIAFCEKNNIDFLINN